MVIVYFSLMCCWTPFAIIFALIFINNMVLLLYLIVYLAELSINIIFASWRNWETFHLCFQSSGTTYTALDYLLFEDILEFLCETICAWSYFCGILPISHYFYYRHWSVYTLTPIGPIFVISIFLKMYPVHLIFLICI